MNHQGVLLLGWVGWLLVGCKAEDPAAEADAPVVVPDSLEKVQVSPGFRFETTRTVQVTLARPEGVGVAGVELRRESGALVFSGGVPPGGARLSLPLAPHETRLVARWIPANGAPRESMLEVQGGQASGGMP